jgi:hypothetical protein
MAKWIPTKGERISFLILLSLLFIFLIGCFNLHYLWYVGLSFVVIGLLFVFVGVFYGHIAQNKYGRRLISMAIAFERIIQGDNNNSKKDNSKPKPNKPPAHLNRNEHNDKSSDNKTDANSNRFSVHTVPPKRKHPKDKP